MVIKKKIPLRNLLPSGDTGRRWLETWDKKERDYRRRMSTILQSKYIPQLLQRWPYGKDRHKCYPLVCKNFNYSNNGLFSEQIQISDISESWKSIQVSTVFQIYLYRCLYIAIPKKWSFLLLFKVFKCIFFVWFISWPK